MTLDPWTIRRVLTWATEDFQARGIQSARLDADLLLAHALETDRIHLILEYDRPLSQSELDSYRRLIQRRRAGEPVAYLVGTREFYGLPIEVDARVLIPRPDTETLVEVALQGTRGQEVDGRALDLCTGSGCVALAFAQQRRTWVTTGIDLSEAAIDVARKNAERLGLVEGTRFLAGDLLAPLGPHEQFQLIVANPPYIPSAEVLELERSIRDYEPRLALDGGEDGLGVLRRIISEAPARLVPSGVLALEVGYDQASEVADVMDRAGFLDVGRHRDYGGLDRVVSGRKG